MVTPDELYVFVDSAKLPFNYEEHFQLNEATVIIDRYENVQSVLQKKANDGRVWISSTSSYALAALVPQKKLYQEITPICFLKSIKNEVEAKGMRDCHIWDGVALCKYFAWLEAAVLNGEDVDEISGATKLEEYRK